MSLTHDKIETTPTLLIVLVILVVAIGGLVEIVPLYFQRTTTEAVKGIKPYEPLRLVGRDIYIREGCYNCHSQMIRPFRAETLRYGHYSVAGEFVFDHPFQWGSKRTGPDLARVGARYSDEWHRVHFNNPRDVVPESNMPAYSWFAKSSLDDVDVQAPHEGAQVDRRAVHGRADRQGARGAQGQDRTRRGDRLPAGPGRRTPQRALRSGHGHQRHSRGADAARVS